MGSFLGIFALHGTALREGHGRVVRPYSMLVTSLKCRDQQSLLVVTSPPADFTPNSRQRHRSS